MAERWAPVAGYEARYEVSTDGRVRSLGPWGTRELKPTPHPRWGHMFVSLSQHGVVTRVGVHRLVARAFFGDAAGPLVRHLNGVPSDNRLSNLAYGTWAENNKDTVRHGHNVNASRVECIEGHEFTEANTYVRPSGSRTCRTCNRAAASRYADRRKAVSA